MFVRTAALFFLIVGCTNEVVAQQQEAESQGVITEQLPAKSIVDGASRLGFDVYQTVRKQKGNLCLSPYSMSYGLAMVALGTGGNTLEIIQQKLYYPLNYLASIGEVDRAFSTQKSSNKKQTELLIANAFWIDQGLTMLPAFEKRFERDFNQRPMRQDFLTNKEIAVRSVNAWTAKKTKELIRTLLARKELENRTQLVLTEATGLKGAWKYPFDSRNTKFLPFSVQNRDRSVNMMQIQQEFVTAHSEKVDLIEIPYLSENDGVEIALVVILPKKNYTLESIENEWNFENWKKWQENAAPELTLLKLPRFNLDSRIDLKIILKDLGLGQLITQEANFSQMTEAKDVYLNVAQHVAVLRVDESGSGKREGRPAEWKENKQALPFFVDRPFLFVITDKKTGAIFLMGRVASP